MIYLAVVLFLLPILLKATQFNYLSVRIVLPTLITYALWYLISYLLIFANMNINYYLYFFYPFPILLLIYEIFLTFKRRKNLFFNKFLRYLIVFIFLNFIVNLFSRIYLAYDAVSYMTWVIDAFNNNAFIKSSEYTFNSYYYISTLFGNYNIPLFFSILSTYIIGIIIYFFILLILDMRMKKINQCVCTDSNKFNYYIFY